MSIKAWVSKGLISSISQIVDLFFPPLCSGCGGYVKGNRFFCLECESKIKPVLPPFCPLCGRPYHLGEMHLCGECLKDTPFFKAARSVFFYEGPVREAIISFKFKENIALRKFWVREILFFLGSFLQKIKPEVILPVPLHIKRLRQRGYNQSLLIAKDLAAKLGLRCEARVLRKVKATPPQVGLTAAERERNVRGSFAVKKKERIKGKCVLLIDDVFTTGSTVNECARVLMQAGAKAVFVITLARATDAV